jgi:hypothetical protein
MDGDKLKAEAWVDILKANKLRPGLIAMLESGKPMDVSTAYFSRHDATPGTFNGRAYSVMHRDIKPDHLALLPDENGACSWADGCGVRANKGADMKKTGAAILSALAAALGINTADDPAIIIANLISDARAPFGESDRAALEAMTAPALTALQKQFIPAANEEDNMTDKTKGKVTVNAADLVKTLGVDQATADKMAAAANAAPAKTPEEIAAEKKKAMMDKIGATNSALTPAILSALPDVALEAMVAAIKPEAKASALSAEDQEAVAFARKVRDDHRASLVTKITGNSDMKAEALKDMPLATLETIAAGLKAAPATANYAGRHVPAANFASEDKVAESMAPVSFAEALAAKNGKKKEAA